MKNKFLSLEWFKNSAERAIENVISKKLESLMEQEESVQPEGPLYKTIKLVNDTLTVVTNNGNVLSKSEATEQDYNNIINAKTFNEILSVIQTQEATDERLAHEAEVKKMQALKKGIKLLADLEDFTVEGNSVFLTGTSRSLPQLLVEKFIEVVDRIADDLDYPWEVQVKLNQDEEYLSLKRFFMWCCLNPRAEVSNELYRFLTENSFRITKQGFFVALRNVVTLHGSPELVHFISNAYNKVKAVWKKNPQEYTVFLENGEYKLVHEDKLYEEKVYTSTTCPDCDGTGGFEDEWESEWEDCETCDGTGEVEEYEYTSVTPVNHGEKIGKLVDLYLDLPNRSENRFTDDWTKTFDIRIGKTVSMPKEECNWSTQDCAAAGLKYVASL